MSREIEALLRQTAPGRQVQTLEESSFDAWIKYYRRDENFSNTGISYYTTRGKWSGFLLDARIREASGGRRSLDDVMRLAYQRHSGERGFRSEDFRALLEEMAGADSTPGSLQALSSRPKISTTARRCAGMACASPRARGQGKGQGERGGQRQREARDPHGLAGGGARDSGRSAHGQGGEAGDPSPSPPGSTSATKILGPGRLPCHPRQLEGPGSRPTAPARRPRSWFPRRDRLARLPATFGQEAPPALEAGGRPAGHLRPEGAPGVRGCGGAGRTARSR